MAQVRLSPVTPQDMDAYVALYEQSFPESERKPLVFMTHGACASSYRLLVASTPDTRVAGMVITVAHKDLVMLDYLAITPSLRGQGLGHEILPLVRDLYKDKSLFLEIESPTEDAPNLQERLRRKAFYTSAGLVPCGVNVYMYDTRMELWAYPECADKVTFEGYDELISERFPIGMRPGRL